MRGEAQDRDGGRIGLELGFGLELELELSRSTLEREMLVRGLPSAGFCKLQGGQKIIFIWRSKSASACRGSCSGAQSIVRSCAVVTPCSRNILSIDILVECK
jgi:hypothetical protein